MRSGEPVVVEALKVRALPGGSCDRLLEFLRLYRDADHLVMSKVWGLDGELSERKLHELFHGKLMSLGYRAPR